MTPFYKKALQLFTRTQEAQIQKGMEKYPEPFNPHSWSPEELLNHALEETVDLTHYLVGLKELLDEKDGVIEALQSQIDALVKDHREEILKYHKMLALKRGTPETVKMLNDLNIGEYEYKQKPKKSPFEEQYDMNFNPHFDQDDQN